MLRRLSLRDVAIVAELEVELGAGFTVLTGETGAGKSILVDALQLALGNRADANLVREGAARAEVSAEFDTPAALRAWLDEAGFDAERNPAAAPHGGRPGQEPRLDQRQPGHRGAVARGGRPAGGHPRPACLAEPHAAGRRARVARRPGAGRHVGAGRRLAGLARGAGSAGRGTRPARDAGART